MIVSTRPGPGSGSSLGGNKCRFGILLERVSPVVEQRTRNVKKTPVVENAGAPWESTFMLSHSRSAGWLNLNLNLNLLEFEIHVLFDFRVSGTIFQLKNGVPEVWEVSKNLPGAGGFIFPKYQPIPIHGDPIQASDQLNVHTSH